MQYLQIVLAAAGYLAAMGGTAAAERIMDRFGVVAESSIQADCPDGDCEEREERAARR